MRVYARECCVVRARVYHKRTQQDLQLTYMVGIGRLSHEQVVGLNISVNISYGGVLRTYV